MQETKVRVLELVPMDLFENTMEITMTNLPILYNTNPMLLTICVMPPPPKLE
jgi:hypothetical protein